MASIFVVEGQTEPLVFRMETTDVAGAVSSFPLASVASVSIVARLSSEAVKTLEGTVEVWPAAGEGAVRFSPDAADLVASDRVLHVRVRVVKTDGKIDFFPRGEWFHWVIQK